MLPPGRRIWCHVISSSRWWRHQPVTFNLSGTHISNRRIMIYSLRTNTFSGWWLVSELFLSTHVTHYLIHENDQTTVSFPTVIGIDWYCVPFDIQILTKIQKLIRKSLSHKNESEKVRKWFIIWHKNSYILVMNTKLATGIVASMTLLIVIAATITVYKRYKLVSIHLILLWATDCLIIS